MQTDVNSLSILLSKQLNNFFTVNIPENFGMYIELAQKRTLRAASCQNAFRNINEINPCHTTQWTFFLYYLSHIVGTENEIRIDLADQIYYLNKIMHSVDWYWAIHLPEICWAEHPIGSILGRAQYGNYFFIYQGCTVGGNYKESKIQYPSFGHHVVMFANSMVIGDSHVGNNVMISAKTYLKDQDIPDNCIVFGQSPNLKIIQKTEAEMLSKMKHIWRTL